MSKSQKLLLGVLAFGLILAVVWVSKQNQKPAEQPPPVAEKPVAPKIPNKPVEPPPQLEFSYDEAIASITEADLRKHMAYLTSKELEGRMTGKNGNKLAQVYIQDFYGKTCGLATTLQKFTMQRMNPGPKNEQGDDFSHNIIAWIDGNDPKLKGEIVVVGAHMDHIGYGPNMSQSPSRREIHPGADDNASGTVALMEITQAFSMLKGKVKRTVVFMSFSGEEMGLIGARYYCNNPIFPKGKPSMQAHVFMLNMDMIGRLGTAKHLASFMEAEDSSEDVTTIINELGKKYSFARSITGRGSGGSDHACFYNKKVPIAFLHTGMHRQYHTPDDTYDTINFPGLEKVARYGFEFAWRVAQSDNAPRFNYGSFRPMDEDHDHGNPDAMFNRKK